MTSKGAKKRRYLDDTNVIHIVNQPAQYEGGEIKQAPGKLRQLSDNIAGSVKQQLSGNAPVSPYLAYPAAGAIAAAIFNPITTLTSLVKGGIGGAAVNKISKKLTNKTWGENVERVLDINPDVAEFTNPGYSAASITKQGVKKALSKTQQAGYNVAKNLFNKGFDFAKEVSSEPLKQKILSGTTAGIKLLPSSSGFIQYGSKVPLSSSNSVIPVTDMGYPYRREILKRMNKIFNSRYGYPKIPLSLAENSLATREAIKDRMLQHRTTIRGVRDEYKHMEDTNQKLIALGLEPTRENRLRYYATHYGGDTGHGKVGFEYKPGLGTIYTSNSFDVAKGYAASRGKDVDTGGMAFVVRPKMDFSSPYLEDWIVNNEFKFNGLGGTQVGSNFFDYDLPYYMKHGKTLTKKYLDEHPIRIDKAEYDRIRKKRTEDFWRIYGITPNDVDIYTRLSKASGFEFPNKIIGNNHEAVAENIIQLESLNALNAYARSNGSTVAKNQADFLRKIYYKKRKNFDKYVEKSKTELKKRITKDLRTIHIESKRDIDKHIQNYAKQLGIKPTQAKQILFGDNTNKNVTINKQLPNSTSMYHNPGQNYVYVGPIDEQGLDIVRELKWNDLKDYRNLQGNHIGPWAPETTRKVRKYGGLVTTRPSLKSGGSIYIKPSHRGRLT